MSSDSVTALRARGWAPGIALQLAWRNLWRAPRRTAVVLVTVTIGIAGVMVSMAINNGMVMQMVETAIATELGHLQIHASGFDETPLLRIRLEDGGERTARALGALPGVQAFARRIRSEGMISSPRANAGVRVVGIEPAGESRVSRLAEWIVEGSYLEAGEGRILLGQDLAHLLHVRVGSKVVVSAQDLAGDLAGEAYRVGGIFHTPSSELDRGTVFIGLAESQHLFQLGDAVSELVVVAEGRGRIGAIQLALREQLGDGVEVKTWQELRPFLVNLVEIFDKTAWTVYAAVFIAMVFGIANVLLMSVFERTRELGVMMALGMRPRQIVWMLVLESTFLTFLGLAVGCGVAVSAVEALSEGIDLSAFSAGLSWMGTGSRIVPVIRSQDVLVPVCVAFVTSLAASLWPASRAARLHPADAVRHV